MAYTVCDVGSDDRSWVFDVGFYEGRRGLLDIQCLNIDPNIRQANLYNYVKHSTSSPVEKYVALDQRVKGHTNI